jgi:mannan endo-1,4-beta-mannosidase
MWFRIFVLAIATAVAFAAPNRTSTIPTIDGYKFKLDGVTRYWAGTNAYWLPFQTNDADVDLVLDHMSAEELRILRIWGFNDVQTIPQNGEHISQSQRSRH